MLKNRFRKENRKLLLVLTLSPLLLLCQLLQLPSQAQTNSPSGGTAGTDSGAPTNGSQTSIFSNPPSPQTVTPTAPTGGTFALTPQSQTNLNVVATSITQNQNLSSTVAAVFTQGSGAAANSLIGNFSTAGVPIQLAQALLTSINNLLPTSGGIIQGNVNINSLNDAIVAYNEIILQSGSDTLTSLSENESFVSIGQTLGQLRSALSQ
ncbi:conserved hypothetical protein [Raphidiopsis brookii D9]|nr:conserved hypothetical protein [Raphidiopsis brookii D9]